MRRTQPWLVALLSGFCASALLSGACGEQDYPATAFRCDPSTDNACPGSYVCCSTDPASLDLASPTADVLPTWAGGTATPIFSGDNNDQSRYGRCVDLDRVDGPTLMDIKGPANGCPVPCNPTWDDTRIGAVCGDDTFCCQTDEVGEKDCVLDPALGDNGCYRPVDGNDIKTLGGLEVTDWATNAHDTHQDPRALHCQDFINGLEPGSSPFPTSDLLKACYRRLTTANQRGLCTPAHGETDVGAVCGLASPDYHDACDKLNEDNAYTGCP